MLVKMRGTFAGKQKSLNRAGTLLLSWTSTNCFNDSIDIGPFDTALCSMDMSSNKMGTYCLMTLAAKASSRLRIYFLRSQLTWPIFIFKVYALSLRASSVPALM